MSKRQTDGSPRIHAELKARGEACCLNTVSRYMRENDIYAKTKRKFKHTTDSNHKLPVAENLLDRQFTQNNNFHLIGKRAQIDDGVVLGYRYPGDTHPTRIGDDAVIRSGSIIYADTTIGNLPDYLLLLVAVVVQHYLVHGGYFFVFSIFGIVGARVGFVQRSVKRGVILCQFIALCCCHHRRCFP